MSTAPDARQFALATVDDLRARRWLRVHVGLIGIVSLALCWGVSRALDAVGVDTLAWRLPLALLLTYPLYLCVLSLWARGLLRRSAHDGAGSLGDGAGSMGDAADALLNAPGSVFRTRTPFQSGGGGDFGGGGASGDFSAPSDAAGSVADAVGEFAGGVLGEADEGAVVAVPLLIVVGVALAVAAGLGVLVFGLFGVEVLLGVAVEIAFASVGTAVAWRARREGWWVHAVRRTRGPMVALCGVAALVGGVLHHWVPQAATVPQALRLLFS